MAYYIKEKEDYKVSTDPGKYLLILLRKPLPIPFALAYIKTTGRSGLQGS
jgi:hypothetical protein